MPEFTDTCSEICSTQEPRNGFSFSKIHHQVMNIFFFCLVSNSCCLSRGCAGATPTPLSLSLLLHKIPKAGSGDCHGASTVLDNPSRVFYSWLGTGSQILIPAASPALPSPLRQLTAASPTSNLHRITLQILLTPEPPGFLAARAGMVLVQGLRFPGRVFWQSLCSSGFVVTVSGNKREAFCKQFC